MPDRPTNGPVDTASAMNRKKSLLSIPIHTRGLGGVTLGERSAGGGVGGKIRFGRKTLGDVHSQAPVVHD